MGIWNVSLLARYVPTQVLIGGDPRDHVRARGRPKRITIASIAYEVALVTAGSIVVAAWGLTQLPALKNDSWRYIIFVVPVAAIVCLHPEMFSHVSTRLLHRFGADTLPSTLSFGTVLRLAGVYVISFIVAGIGTLGMARALHSIDTADIPLIISSWSVGYAGALLAFFIPGGIGVREGAVAAVLSMAMPTSVAIAVAIAVRLAQTGIELPTPARRCSRAPAARARGRERKAAVSAKRVGRADLVEALGRRVAGELAAPRQRAVDLGEVGRRRRRCSSAAARQDAQAVVDPVHVGRRRGLVVADDAVLLEDARWRCPSGPRCAARSSAPAGPTAANARSTSA